MQELAYCDLCGHSTPISTVLYDLRDNEGITTDIFRIVKCRQPDCGHYFLCPTPNSVDELNRFYSRDYYAHTALSIQRTIKYRIKKVLNDKYYKKSTKISFFQHILFVFLKKTVNEPPIIKDGKLCDVGCGNGEYISRAQSYGWEVYGVEPNKNAVVHCLSMGLNVKQGYAEKIPFNDFSFNVVRMWNVLEHTISPKRALSEVYRVLKKNGYLLFYVPNFNSIDRKVFGRYWGGLKCPDIFSISPTGL